MNVFAVDPGKISAWVLMSPTEIHVKGRCSQVEILDLAREIARGNLSFRGVGIEHIVIENIGHYGTGMPAGRDVFDTCRLIGRMEEIFERKMESSAPSLNQALTHLIKRQSIKTHLCGRSTAKDSNVRQAVIDRFGGNAKAIGGKRCPNCKGKGWKGSGRPICLPCDGCGWETKPGPLHGIASHEWSALAAGLYFIEQSQPKGKTR